MAAPTRTWWGEAFLESIENVVDRFRLKRGKVYVNDDRCQKFSVKNGVVTARLIGTFNPLYGGFEREPKYNVFVRFTRIPESDWRQFLQRIGSNADWVTHLILGQVPPTIERAFGSSVSLLPSSQGDYTSSCSCWDDVNPCEHVVGVYYRLASLLDRQPLLLFELRGMKRKRLMRALGKSEFGAALTSKEPRRPSLAKWAVKGRFPPVETSIDVADPGDLRSFWRGIPLPRDAGIGRDVPPTSALLVRREGDYPAFWERHDSFVEAMAAFYDRVAKSLPRGPTVGAATSYRS